MSHELAIRSPSTVKLDKSNFLHGQAPMNVRHLVDEFRINHFSADNYHELSSEKSYPTFEQLVPNVN